MNITDFLNSELVNYASYDNLRKIGSCIDGLKNASRKVLFTVHEKKIKDKIKVSQLSAKCAEYSDYLHGDNLWNVIVTLGKDYAGTNNIPLIKKFGNFGTRCINESSAPRYIFAHGSEEFFKYFMYEDDSILEQQYFEGNRIEPKFYVPTLPFLLVNGSEGVSSGFAQKILPRNVNNLKKYIKQKLNGKNPSEELLMPFFNNFNGDIEADSETKNKFIIKGKIQHVKHYEYLITEIPITYDLKSYIKVLEDLEDKGIVKRWKNESDGENVLQFRVWLSKFHDDEKLLDSLKLIKSITENYTCIDENNKIIEFNNAKEIIDHFIDFKLKYMQKRKDLIVQTIKSHLDILNQKIKFIDYYINKKIKIHNVSLSEIEKQLNDYKFEKQNDSFSYLLSISLFSLSKEKRNELENERLKNEQSLKEILNTEVSDMWLKDLNV